LVAVHVVRRAWRLVAGMIAMLSVVAVRVVRIGWRVCGIALLLCCRAGAAHARPALARAVLTARRRARESQKPNDEPALFHDVLLAISVALRGRPRCDGGSLNRCAEHIGPRALRWGLAAHASSTSGGIDDVPRALRDISPLTAYLGRAAPLSAFPMVARRAK
jgi:hypothetical protein